MVQLVGILNVTPDSFSDGGEFFSSEAACAQAEQLFADGASIVDVGAESTRPKATPLSAEEEWRRLEPVLSVLLPKHPGKISLDSYRPETIRRASMIGPVIINDITGMNNPEMVAVAAELRSRVIISHLPGHDIQHAHQTTPITSVREVRDDLLAKAQKLQAEGLHRAQIILDPGVGFGKQRELNWQLLRFGMEVPDFEVMIGYSRKRFLGEDRMDITPNLEAGKIASEHGATYLRVHDVAGHRQLLT